MPKLVKQERFISEALEAHNKYRKQHCVGELTIDPRLNELALEWAENLATIGSLKYKNATYCDENLGENILKFKLKESKTFYFSGIFYSHHTKVINKTCLKKILI